MICCAAPKLKGRKRRKKLSGYIVNETSRVEQTETRAKAVSTLLQVVCSGIYVCIVDGMEM